MLVTERARLLDREPTDVLVLLLAILKFSHSEEERFIPVVQAIIERRLHAEQIDSQSTLRTTMENVSATLLKVEENQKGLELANLKLARSANRLGVVQVVVAVIFGIAGAMQACAPTPAGDWMRGSGSEAVSDPEPQHLPN